MKKVFSIIILSLVLQVCSAQLIPAPVLHCAAPDPARNDVLTWDAVGNQPCGAFIGYRVYRASSAAGPYVLDTVITDQSATTWSDHGAANNTYYYYMQDSFNCPGATYASSDTIRNEANPQTPVIEGVDVLPDSTIQFSWDPSTSPQTRYYVIYIITPNGQPLAVDTVYGRFNTTWIDSLRNPYSTSLKYTVDARDSCQYGQPSAFNTSPQQSIFAQYQTAHCDKAIKLNWTQYVNLPGGVIGYKVFVSVNNAPYTQATMVDSNTFNYDFPDFADGDSLQIYITAVSARDTTHMLHSNYMRFTANVIKPPSYNFISNITVDLSNNIDVSWIVDNKAKVLSYELQNSEDNTTYLIKGIQNVAPPIAPTGYYADSDNVQPQYEPYYYTVTAFDSCNGSIVSPYARHISLQATLSDYYEITLNWNPLHIYDAVVLRQNLYRDLGTGQGYQLVRTFDSTTVSYVDSVYQYLNDPGAFCYRIEAVYHIVLPPANFDSVMSSFSNLACVDHRPIIYIPNAFVQNGVNNFFKPKIIFGDPTGYTMIIYNRYGGKIFETNDPNEGWYGTDGGKPVTQGAYAYLIKFTASDGTAIERKGLVTMLRK